MSSFRVPLSSSPPAPSTPNTSAKRITKSNPSSFFTSNPSTTPAGPPPSSVGSFTPADPPPSSIYGSSQLGSGRTLFKSKNTSRAIPKSQRRDAPSSVSEKLAKQLEYSSRFDLSSINDRSARSIFDLSENDLSQPGSSANGHDEQGEDALEDELLGVSQELPDRLGERLRGSIADASFSSTSMGSSSGFAQRTSSYSGENGATFLGSSLLAPSPRGVKRSRGGATMPHGPLQNMKKPTRLKKDSAIPSIAKAMTTQIGVAALTEPDYLILKTEDVIATLYAAESNGEKNLEGVRTALPKISETICNLWVSCCDRKIVSSQRKEDAIIGIGPEDGAPSLYKAVFVSTLLLQLHHPPTAKGKQALALTRLGSSFSSSRPPVGGEMPLNPTAIPKILMDWLNKHHNPWQSTFIEVETKIPSPPAHYNFWDVIFVLILRGKIRDAVRILKKSDFHCAETSRRDGQNEGYTDLQVRNIQRVVNKAIEVLQSCPALKDENWHIIGSEWAIFRKRVEQAIDDLALFAEGRDRDMGPSDSTIEASDFGSHSTTLSHTQIARRAESRVPWSVYQSLKATYGILLGGTTEIVSSAQDWVEASIGLTIWWTGEDTESVSVGTLAMTRRSLRLSQNLGQRAVDVDSEAAYVDRLNYSFQRATDDADDDDFQINSNNPVEVCLASAFEGNVEGVMRFLHGWSLPVAAAVAEISTHGGWFGSSLAVPGGMMKGFDESDLIVLSSYRHSDPPMRRDTIMIDYADALFERGKLRGDEIEVVREGWELSIALLIRLGDDQVSSREIGKILKRLPMESDARLDMILRICGDYGMEKDARAITEKYADKVVETSDNYGTALIYYARAHNRTKIINVLDLLVSLSIVQSAAFPPLASLDSNLHSLVFDPKPTIMQLATFDQEAAVMLHDNLTGYATLRKFYELRDEAANLEKGQKTALEPMARKRAVTTELLAVISSAADNIYGGLYDDSRKAVIRVEGLLSLLGEALVFVNQPMSLLSLPQCFSLLKAIEDLETVSGRVFDRCEECFHSTIAAHQGDELAASPRQLLKAMSSMTSASSFSLVGSSLLESKTSDTMDSSHALVKSQQQETRGWDWREGVARDAKGEDVLRILRLGLAKDIARHWIDNDY